MVRRFLRALLTVAGVYLTERSIRAVRNIILIVSLAPAVILATTVGSTYQEDPPVPPCVSNKVDLAFIIDVSGSLAVSNRGQAYNVQIEGIVSALRNPSVVPRDGSVAVAVITFAERPSVIEEFKEINSFADAEEIAAKVEALRCDPSAPISACPVLGSNPGTFYSNAIKEANDLLSKHKRAGARRVLLMSSDGEPSDPEKAREASAMVCKSTSDVGMESELDLILIGLRSGTETFSDSLSMAKDIVCPSPGDDLPGAVLTIDSGNSSNSHGSSDDPEFIRQVTEFAEHVRKVLRNKIEARTLVVTTSADIAEGQSADAAQGTGELSLRQAIEQANCNGGATTIIFAENIKGSIIRPRTPLPALQAPDITIDGCGTPDTSGGECDRPDCAPSVSIDGSLTDTSRGEAHGYGILIRSNRNRIRGLKLAHFKLAGIAVDPVGPSDNAGFNRIERNTLENNEAIGILIADPKSGEKSAIAHNVGNTISMNTISGSRTLIDLGADGPTKNDPGDLDEGPNTLLNTPEDMVLTQAGSSVTIKGNATPNGIVEIFAVTKIDTSSGNLIAKAVSFLTKLPANSKGEFMAEGLCPSPTGFYAATATDALTGRTYTGTSELSKLSDLTCAGAAAAKAVLEQGRRFLKFGPIDAPGKAEKKPENSSTFTIENTGGCPLELSFGSLLRKRASSAIPLTDKHLSDSKFFSVSSLNNDSGETDFERDSQHITILPGQHNARKFRIYFHPEIPPPTTKDQALSADRVLPDKFKSQLLLNHNGSGDREVVLKAQVNDRVKLINPVDLRQKALVILQRSGDDLFVTFFVYDSNLDVSGVEFQFLDCSGGTVPADKAVADLKNAIRNRGIVKGQSFTVIQRFSNAKAHPDVHIVRLRIFDDKNSEDRAESSSVNSVSLNSIIQSPEAGRSTTLLLPPLKFARVSRGRN
jgi:hypothetical protein